MKNNKTLSPAPIRDTVAEVSARCDELLSDRSKRRRSLETVRSAAASNLEALEREARESLDDADAFAKASGELTAARARLQTAEKELEKLEETPLIDKAEYEALKRSIYDAVEIERQAFIDMLAIHAGVLAEEAKNLAKYQNRANEALQKLQNDVYHDTARYEIRNGRKYYEPLTPERVELSGMIQTARSLALSPLLSGRVTFKDAAELSAVGFGEK